MLFFDDYTTNALRLQELEKNLQSAAGKQIGKDRK